MQLKSGGPHAHWYSRSVSDRWISRQPAGFGGGGPRRDAGEPNRSAGRREGARAAAVGNRDRRQGCPRHPRPRSSQRGERRHGAHRRCDRGPRGDGARGGDRFRRFSRCRQPEDRRRLGRAAFRRRRQQARQHYAGADQGSRSQRRPNTRRTRRSSFSVRPAVCSRGISIISADPNTGQTAERWPGVHA